MNATARPFPGARLLLAALIGACAAPPPGPDAPPARPDTTALDPGPRPDTIPRGWQGLVGEYGPDTAAVLVLENRGVLVLLEDSVRARLRALRPDTFAIIGGAAGARVAFTRDPAGRATRVDIAGRTLERRRLEGEDGGTFRIVPLRPVEELRREALAAEPPLEEGSFRETDLVELRDLDPSIRYDIRYATTNNFMGAVFYTSEHAFLQRRAAQAVARASERLRAHGYGLLVHDAYRPWHVTKMFWDATPEAQRDFVADPATGSRHNRGAAVDLTLYVLASGRPVDMVSGYDEFSPRAHPDYPGGTSLQRWHRALLRAAMEAEGFTVYPAEWWHFDHRSWARYRIGNQRFEDLAR